LPGNADADSLRRQYPHIDSASKTNTKVEKSTSDKSNAKARAKSTIQKRDIKRKPEKKQAPKNIVNEAILLEKHMTEYVDDRRTRIEKRYYERKRGKRA
ncbi:hypothetical protein H9Q70_014727, partial [Fusarium xylarioides]